MKYWHLEVRQENAFNHVLAGCLLFPQAVWDLQACSQMKRRPDFALGQCEILRWKQTGAEQEMGCPGPGCTTLPHTSLHYLIWASKIPLGTCMNKWRWSVISNTYCWVNIFSRIWHAGFSPVSDKDSEGNWLTHLCTKAFSFPFGSFCRIVGSCLLRTTCCQSWEESSCSRDDQVCY